MSDITSGYFPLPPPKFENYKEWNIANLKRKKKKNVNQSRGAKKRQRGKLTRKNLRLHRINQNQEEEEKKDEVTGEAMDRWKNTGGRMKVRKKGTKKKARRRIIYKSKATKRFLDTFNIKKRKKNHKYPFTRGNLFYLNKKSHGKRITARIIRKYPKAFTVKLRKRFL